MMYILNITSSVKSWETMNSETLSLIFENYYKRIGFSKKSSYYSMKHQKKRSTSVSNQIKRKNS